MNEQTWLSKSVDLARETYGALLGEVVETHVINDREEIPLGQETKRRLEKGLTANPNIIRLLGISGKGGASLENHGEENAYARYYNITLLDHLLSTVRGAVVFAALEWLAHNHEMDTSVISRRLRVVAAIAFLHDLDKDLRRPRNTPLSEKMVMEAMRRYGLDDFLAAEGVFLEPDQMLYLIEKTEASQAHRHPPKALPPREFEPLPLFVRLADQLDGIWCLDDPVSGGLEGVLKRIQTDESLIRSGFLKSWKPVRIFDPHHPFILDELQRNLSLASVRKSGMPPLIETHRDGELFMLLPGEHAPAIIEKAITQLCKQLPFDLRLDVPNRGVPSLYDGKPSHSRLAGFIAGDLDDRKLADLFKIKASLMPQVMRPLDDLLMPHGIAPRWPRNVPGALVSIYSSFSEMGETEKGIIHRAAHLALLLNLKVDAGARSGIPSYNERERALAGLAGVPRPDWIAAISGEGHATADQSVRTLTALWITALAQESHDLREAVWGENGLLHHWLEGEEGKSGMRDFITGRGAVATAGLHRMLSQLLSGSRVAPEDESTRGRCLFTGEPAPFDEPIDQALGLYGVKVSAFSGREGRPELITSERAHTIVGASSVAEHKKRAEEHKTLGGRDDGVPALVSSPTTSGLFGGLVLTDDKSMSAMSTFDLNRLDVKKGKIIRETDIHRRRFRIARLERMPERLKEQVNKLRMLLKACRRIGRPLHIFRGLPMAERSYFFYDAMPQALMDLLGTNAFRLEQIPAAIERLETAQVILEEHGLEYDVFRRYACPSTRFGAICLAWCKLREGQGKDKKSPKNVLIRFEETYRKYTEEKRMSEQDGALVKFGLAAASIQKRPPSGASANEELLVFKIAMDAVTAAQRIGQMDEASLICAIAGELETTLARRDKTWLTQPEALRKRCIDVAQLFVKEVWLGALKEKMPGQNSRRIMASIYRMAFVTAHRKQ